MADLFGKSSFENPLADRVRPKKVEDFVGQERLLEKGRIVYELLKLDKIPSLIFWGPPGCGKTSLAEVIANKTKAFFVKLSAASSGIAEVKKVIEQARERKALYGQQTIVFIDEIHRFNKAQQDALLPHVEKGTITLIGATTENPSFEVISPLLSRSKVLVLDSLKPEHIEKVLIRGAEALGFKNLDFIDEQALKALINYANGDARVALNALETAVNLSQISPNTPNPPKIPKSTIEEALQTNLRYDRVGEEHYNTISAFIKSMRGSDPNAALYYLSRMLEAGEDPLFIARRMVIFASEDISNADPQALTLAVSVFLACERIGLPECQINLAHGVTYLACAPKSNSSYGALMLAKKDVLEYQNLPIPLHLRNAPTKLMKELNYGKDYKYAHNFDNHYVVGEVYLPKEIQSHRYFFPNEQGEEKKLKERLTSLRRRLGLSGQ